PRQLADLARHNCLRYVFYPFGDEWRFTGPDGKPLSVRVSGNLIAASGEALRMAALRGIGVMLAPGFVIGEDIAAGRLVPLLPKSRPTEFAINAVYAHRQHLSAKIRAFIDLLAARIAEQPSLLFPEAAPAST